MPRKPVRFQDIEPHRIARVACKLGWTQAKLKATLKELDEEYAEKQARRQKQATALRHLTQ